MSSSGVNVYTRTALIECDHCGAVEVVDVIVDPETATAGFACGSCDHDTEVDYDSLFETPYDRIEDDE